MSEIDFEQTAQVWLEDGPTVMPGRGLAAALEEIHVTRQRRSRWTVRRFLEMNTAIRLAIGAAAVVVMAVLGLRVVTGNPVTGPAAIATVAPTSVPLPTPAPSSI